jgi:hypothetical protein
LHNKCTSDHADSESDGKKSLKITKRLHQHITRNNTPGIVPQPVVIDPVPPMAAPTAQDPKWITRLTRGLFNCSHPFVAQPAQRTRQWGAAPTQI